MRKTFQPRPPLAAAALALVLAIAACEPKPGTEPTDARPVDPKASDIGPRTDTQSACTLAARCPQKAAEPQALSL